MRFSLSIQNPLDQVVVIHPLLGTFWMTTSLQIEYRSGEAMPLKKDHHIQVFQGITRVERLTELYGCRRESTGSSNLFSMNADRSFSICHVFTGSSNQSSPPECQFPIISLRKRDKEEGTKDPSSIYQIFCEENGILKGIIITDSNDLVSGEKNNEKKTFRKEKVLFSKKEVRGFPFRVSSLTSKKITRPRTISRRSPTSRTSPTTISTTSVPTVIALAITTTTTPTTTTAVTTTATTTTITTRTTAIDRNRSRLGPGSVSFLFEKGYYM